MRRGVAVLTRGRAGRVRCAGAGIPAGIVVCQAQHEVVDLPAVPSKGMTISLAIDNPMPKETRLRTRLATRGGDRVVGDVGTSRKNVTATAFCAQAWAASDNVRGR